MREVSVSAWLATAGVGVSLLGTWVGRGALRHRGRGRRRLRLQLIGTHALLAVVGLGLWIAFFVTDLDYLRWATAAVLASVILAGSISFYIWQSRRLGVFRATPASWDLPTLPAREDEIPPEQHFPAAVVVLHGVFAIVTAACVGLLIAGVTSWSEIRSWW